MALLQLRAYGPEDNLSLGEGESFFRPYRYINRRFPRIRREGRAGTWEFWVREQIAAAYSDTAFSIDVRPTLEHSSHGIAGLPPLPDWLFGPGRQPRARLEDLWETVTGSRPVVQEMDPITHRGALESTADDFRRRALFRGYRAGIAQQRREVEWASRAIGEAVLEWSCRPGGACARLAQRSFEHGGASTGPTTSSSRLRAD